MSASPRLDSPNRRSLLVGGLALALSGCSRQQDSPSPAPATADVPRHPSDAETIAANAPDLRIHAVLLPGVIDSSTQGPFIDLIRVLDEAYLAGTFQIKAYPLARVLDNLKHQLCDVGFPSLRMGNDEGLPYRFSTESVGKVSFVLYVNRESPLTRAQIEAAAAQGKAAYRIEAPSIHWGFDVSPLLTLESALKKVSMGRLDALLWAQEEADMTLRQLGLDNIRRIHFGDFEDVFMLERSQRGHFADQVLTQTIRKLRASGRLQEIYRHIHRPYVDWQP